MADSKKYNGSTWQHSLRKLTTATDTLTTLPVDIYADGNNATVSLKGNTVQSSIPSPTSPIIPQGTGERTGNLFDYTDRTEIINNSYINRSGSITESADYYTSYPIEVEAGATYTWRFNSDNTSVLHAAPTVGYYDGNNTLIGVASHSSNVRFFSFTIPTDCKFIRCSVYQRNGVQSEAMLNLGSEALPYEPYGYKIPISMGGTTTPVYLGEVQTVRVIKKYAFTGEESFAREAAYNRFVLTLQDAKIEGLRLTQVYCTNFTSVYDGRPVSDVPNNAIYSSDAAANIFFIKTTDYTDVPTFKAWLAQQYANGTPVTVYYVLATPQTATVNEPLMKIGTYADSLTTSIPCTAGSNSFDVSTTVQPSEVTATYEGWHTGTVHERENGQWN